MLEFTRALTPNQIEILSLLENSSGNRWFNRRPGFNIYKAIKNVGLWRESSFFRRDASSYKRAIEVLENIEKFLKKKIKNSKLLNSIEMYLFEVGRNDPPGLKPVTRLSGIIQYEGYKMLESDRPDEDFYQAVRNSIRPGYPMFEEQWNIPSSKVEGVASNLQGIISIWGHFHRYKDVFIPEHVFERIVKPALEDPKHQINIKVEEEIALEIFNLIYLRTVELRKQYGDQYRPRFTRPEICREIGIKMPQAHHFKKKMKPLEGILGQVVDEDSFNVKLKGGKNYSVGYGVYSWFLPLRHQRIIETEKD